jgi:hypothetical protein
MEAAQKYTRADLLFLCTVKPCINSVILILTTLSNVLRNYAKVQIFVKTGANDNYLHKNVHNGLNSENYFPSCLLPKNLHFKRSCLLYPKWIPVTEVS